MSNKMNKRTVYEWCVYCQNQVEISAIGISKCPDCGKLILPWSIGIEHTATCPC